jgi:hypothetical protein
LSYYKDAKVGDKVYGLIFAKGKISAIYENSHYSIMITFKNGYEVPYTEDGVPGWGNFTKQTCFYRDDIDLLKVDFSPANEILSDKKIIKYREKEILEVRLPSGAWINVKKCPDDYIEDICEAEQYYLFRKKTKK